MEREANIFIAACTLVGEIMDSVMHEDDIKELIKEEIAFKYLELEKAKEILNVSFHIF